MSTLPPDSANNKVAKEKIVTQNEMSDFAAQYAIMRAQEDQNELVIGVQVISKKQLQGSPKKDKVGNIQTDEEGNVLTWDDSFIVDIAFFGGSMQERVDAATFKELEIGKRYTVKGRLATRSVDSGSGFARPVWVVQLTSWHGLF